MARQNQESVTTFGEVLHSSNISYSQNRSSANDNRLMIYFQGMKVYIPDNSQKTPLGFSSPVELRIFASRSRDWLQLLHSALNWILIMGTVSSSSVTGKEIL